MMYEKRYVVELVEDEPKYLMYNFQTRKYFFNENFMNASKCVTKDAAEDIIKMYRNDQKDWDTNMRIRSVTVTYEIDKYE